jgi:hypothetical protein
VLAFLALNGAAALLAVLIARRETGGARATLFRSLCAFVVVIHGAVLAPGLAGALHVGGVATAVVIGLAAVCVRGRRPASREHVTADVPRCSTAAMFGALVAGATGIVWVWPHLTGATRLWIWDDYTYHMVYPAVWLREQAIAVVTPEHAFTMQAWYPLSASVIATWFMVPFAGSRADALAWVSLTGVLYAAIVACGTAELLARLGCRRGAWAVAVVLFATSHRVGVMASSFSDADLAHAAALFAALVFAMPRGVEDRDVDALPDHERAPGSAVRADVWYAGLLTGIAIGVKVSAAPTALVVLGLVMWRMAGLRSAVRVALIFAGAWVVTGGYWYVRNVVHTENPVYPAAFLVWPGTTFPQTTLGEYAREYGLVRAVGDALIVYLNWPRFHAAAAIAGLVGIAAWCLVRTRSRPKRMFTVGALAISAITIALLPSTPYSAGNGMTFVSGFIHWDSMRYVALLPILGWAAVGVLLDAGAGAPLWRMLVAIAVIAGALATSPLEWRHVVVVVAAAALLAAARSRAAARTRAGRMGRLASRPAVVAAVGGVVIAAAFVALMHGPRAAATAASIRHEPLFGAATTVIDRQPPGTRVAVFGDQWIYPAFGAAHHLVPVRLDGDGRIASTPIGDAFEPGALTVHPLRFRANLRDARIGIVAVVRLPHPGRSGEWPAQANALDAVDGARMIYRDRAVGLWRLTD